ncbi:MAG TPA: hypothetical protein VJP40_03700 [bacterium]|nr:hypothetical protein [bacterium]
MVPPIRLKIFDPQTIEIALDIAQVVVEGGLREISDFAKSKGLTDLEARTYRETPDARESGKTKSFFFDLLKSEGSGKYVGYGVLAFAPWVLPLAEAQYSLPLPNLAEKLGIDLSWDGLRASLNDFSKGAAENRRKFEQEIEGAIQNPSLEDLSKGDLFVLDEAGLNDLVAELMSKGGKQKVRNVQVKIDGDRLKISGEYDHWSGWYKFTALAEFELKDGKSSGYVKKIEALGMDLTDDVKNDILAQFRNFDIEPPEDADIKDLSWVQLPGIKRIEIRRDRIILEREPKPGGPS